MKPPISARYLALKLLMEWQRGQAHAQDLIDTVARHEQLDGRDTALLQTLVYSVLRNATLLDHWVEQLCQNNKLQLEVRCLLQLGLSQLLLLELPPHAVVNETVDLAGKARGLVNAVLRRAQREKDAIFDELRELPPFVRYSHPEWLVDRWIQHFGRETAKSLCEWNQRPAETYLRLNRLHPEWTEASEQGFSSDLLQPTKWPGFYQASRVPRELLAEGVCYVQDPSTAVACELLAPMAGETVLDACAAPGGKSALMAQAMNNQGRLIATDSQPKRLERLAQNLEKMKVQCAEIHAHDWTSMAACKAVGDGVDAILLDAPCSNSGVMRRRVDVRWNVEAWTFKKMSELQIRLLTNMVPALKPGGRVVYSTCSLDPEENEQVVAAVLQKHPELTLKEERKSLSWRDGADGAYAALLTKR